MEILLTIILSFGVALSPIFAIRSFSFTLSCSIRISAFLLDVYPELAIIFWIRCMLIYKLWSFKVVVNFVNLSLLN